MFSAMEVRVSRGEFQTMMTSVSPGQVSIMTKRGFMKSCKREVVWDIMMRV